MVLAWVMDNSDGDKRLPHKTDPPQYVSMEELQEKTGCEYYYLDPKDYQNDLDKIKADRGYNYQDCINIKVDVLPNFEEKVRGFTTEHIHSDEEIRFCLEGSGYYDARDDNDRWVRIEMKPGDMLILPAGIYHRFCLDRNNYIRALRLFANEPVWTPINRPGADKHPVRIEYVGKYPSRG